MLYNFFVYIVTNPNRSTLYVGMTNNVQRRLGQHYFDSQNARITFAGRYNCYNLVYYEGFDTPKQAITREKEIKNWRREKKERLINSFNPSWKFLNYQVF